MRKRFHSVRVSALSRTWAAVHLHCRALIAGASTRHRHATHDHHHDLAHDHHAWNAQRRCGELLRGQRPLTRWLVYGGTGLAAFALVSTGLAWWRLSSGPLSMDLVTPWITAAVEQRLGGGQRIEVGGTQLERDDDGQTALRLRDIVVRDRDGTVIASAPKAEVGLSGSSLLMGQVQAVRLSLIGATMSVRIEPDGQVNVFAGAEQRLAAGPVVTPVPQASTMTGKWAPSAHRAPARPARTRSPACWLGSTGSTRWDWMAASSTKSG